MKKKAPKKRKAPRPLVLSREAQEAETAASKERFLEAYGEHGTVFHAAKAAGVGRRSVYRWRDEDEVFAQRLQDAIDDQDDLIDAELDRRGRLGWDEPVFGSLGAQMGTGVVGEIRKFSDAALIFRAKTRQTGRFRERTEITGKDGGPIEHAITKIERVLIDPKTEGA